MSKTDLGRKRLTRIQLKSRIESERRAGRRVVFTNGCFDLLHVGHVRYLQAARAKGDRLVVAVNVDETVRALKGPGRPLLPLDERLRILAALACVDYVVAFDEPTPHEIISDLRPAVLVKGGDYAIEEIVGRDVLWSYGGEVCTVPMTAGLSTTRIIETIRGGNPKR